jgi:hypothetical protein
MVAVTPAMEATVATAVTGAVASFERPASGSMDRGGRSCVVA